MLDRSPFRSAQTYFVSLRPFACIYHCCNCLRQYFRASKFQVNYTGWQLERTTVVILTFIYLQYLSLTEILMSLKPLKRAFFNFHKKLLFCWPPSRISENYLTLYHKWSFGKISKGPKGQPCHIKPHHVIFCHILQNNGTFHHIVYSKFWNLIPKIELNDMFNGPRHLTDNRLLLTIIRNVLSSKDFRIPSFLYALEKYLSISIISSTFSNAVLVAKW